MKTTAESSETSLLLRMAQLEKRVIDLLAKNELLMAENSALKAQNAKLKERIARLEKDSSNSSLPPSSDIGSPKEVVPKKKGSGKKIGGQPGHKRNIRTPFSEDQVDARCDHAIPQAEAQARGLSFLRWEEWDQAELKLKPFDVTRHRRAVYQDVNGKIILATIQDPTHAGLFGMRMKAFTASLQISCHASIRNIQQLFRDVLMLPVSTGYLCKVLAQVSEAIAPAWEELKADVPKQDALWMDETGHKENGSGKKIWTWAAVSPEFAFFMVRASRGSKVVAEILGETFKGVLHCDYFSAYVCIGKDGTLHIQHCVAHLLRELVWLSEHPDEAVKQWGAMMLGTLRHILNWKKRGLVKEAGLMRDIFLIGAQEIQVPQHHDAQVMASRLRKESHRYFRFLWDPLAEPTNNRAERALRPLVLHRKCTQGTRGDTGQRWWERAWTAVMTCRQQVRSVTAFFVDALIAKVRGTACPSLVRMLAPSPVAAL